MFKKSINLFALILICFFSFAQKKSMLENKNVKKGVFVSYLNSDFSYTESNWRQTTYNDSLTSIHSSSGSGYALGLMLQPSINRNFSLRFSPKLMLETGKFSFVKQNEVEKVEISKVHIGLPIQVIYSAPSVSKRFYSVFGSTFKIGIDDDNETKNTMPTKQFDISGDIGLGFLIEGKSFVFSPEIVFSKGILNLKGDAESLYHAVIDRYTLNMLSLTLIFRSK